ncbi:cytochrome c [Enterovibrio makurazakiensis]|uniref:Cytochrome c n=1 Tax=Enterovibrio gelatinilyticus TaxID=2899819 RepID=A0ABT5R6I9_9GAMM|nr:cytochrome c [Enterovibrio sp. ZSDZ42]MDD1795386.1 cytochrome c [Enterovibrio sp. ZSDZ42]
MRKLSVSKVWLSMLSAGFLMAASATAGDFTQQIDERQKGFLSFADNVKTMKKLEDGRDSDWEKIRALAIQNSETLATLPALFPEGSDTGSRSRSTVWTKWDKFEKDLSKLDSQFVDMASAAEAQDAKALTKAFKAADRSCKSCHRGFRVKR